MFRETDRFHLSFRLRCDQEDDLVFSDDLLFHTLELPKFGISGDNVNVLPPLEKWLYFLQQAEYLEADDLAEKLVDDEFREAAGVLEMISKSPADRYYYEARMKALRDEATRLKAAEEEADSAREQGREQGSEQGREESYDEGILIGKIQLMQEFLGEEIMSQADLLQYGSHELTSLMAELRQRLRSR